MIILEDIMLSESSQPQKTIYHITSLILNVQSRKIYSRDTEVGQ